ncbi:MAG: RNA polymerase-associated protein rapA [Magnetococcales bacterium]|nr:RNA polymerase-associated protein rapA [Magnetococcales bacterium]
MRKKRAVLTLCGMLGMGGAAAAMAEESVQPSAPAEAAPWEIHGVLKNESAWMTREGDGAGKRAGRWLKFENSLTLFANRPMGENSALHAQLSPIYESHGEEGERGHQDYSQHDYLRELYLDSNLGGVDVRLGKQQEVWGTADGIKLLDILNPTDYREFNQNTMADARIPVWMLKASHAVGGTGNLQFLLAQHQENHIPGLTASGETGGAFVMKGVDAITGRRNGFLQITPQLGRVASTFNGMAGGNLAAMPGADRVTVQQFIEGGTPFNCPGISGVACLDRITQTTNQNRTLLVDGNRWDANSPRTAFEYMNRATFATFGGFSGVQSAYRRDYPGALALNAGLRYKGSMEGNFNYSLNYLNHYDPNPHVILGWEDGQGNPLRIGRTVSGANTTLHFQDGSGAAYGGPATLIFTEKVRRINSLGGSFDTSVESGLLGPVVMRGEAVYQMGSKTPVVDRDRLAQGDLAGALQSKSTDLFKYVLGAEFIAFTNWTIGGQFIQFVQRDHVDEPGDGSANSGRYSADPALMSLENGLLKAPQFKEFASLFLSKPLGAEQQGRLNNLTMAEERGGWWNRLDGEWKLNDNWVTSAEWNQYGGNENTLFGQFKDLSNVQVGLKYLF